MQLNSKKAGIALLVLLFYFASCQYLTDAIHPDPHPDWVDVEYPVDTVPSDSIPIDSLVVVLDTVCTTYDPITSPEFITAYMEMDPYQTDRILIVGSYRDTVSATDDIQVALDSMIGLLLPNYPRRVYVNDNDDRLMSVMIRGSNDKNLLLGKLRIDYNNIRHIFGCISQSMIVAGSQTVQEFNENLVLFPSFRYINWRNMEMDQATQDTSVGIALDTSNCKGGRDLFDTRHSPNPTPPVFLVYSDKAGWIDALGALHDPGQTVDLTAIRASNDMIRYWVEAGNSVKFRSNSD